MFYVTKRQVSAFSRRRCFRGLVGSAVSPPARGAEIVWSREMERIGGLLSNPVKMSSKTRGQPQIKTLWLSRDKVAIKPRSGSLGFVDFDDVVSRLSLSRHPRAASGVSLFRKPLSRFRHDRKWRQAIPTLRILEPTPIPVSMSMYIGLLERAHWTNE
jgi:hypothetical protein